MYELSGFNLFIAYKFKSVTTDSSYTPEEIDKHISAVWAQVKPNMKPVFYTGEPCTDIYPDDTTTV